MTQDHDEPGRHLKVWLPAVRVSSGADVFVERLADSLLRLGHEPIVQWFDRRFEYAPWALSSVALPRGVDVVHAGSWQGFAFKRKGIPLIVTEHHDVMDPAYRPYKSGAQAVYHSVLVDRWMTRSFNAADRVTAVSKFTAGVLAAHRSVAAVVIRNWVDTEKFRPVSHTRRPGPFRLLWIGNMSRRKGVDVLPELARRLGAGFQIRCTGGLRESHRVELPANIELLGRLSEDALIEAYNDADALLVLSRYEGFGYSALEAMACGTPVVGYGCAAIREVVGAQGAHLVTDVDDLEGVVEICKHVDQNRTMLEQCAGHVRQRAVDAFDEISALNAYSAVYSSAVRTATST